MATSTTVAGMDRASRERRWEQSRAERISTRADLIRLATETAIERIMKTGYPNFGDLHQVTKEYNDERTFFGREYVVPVYGEKIKLWKLEEQKIYFGLDGNFYVYESSSRAGKNGYTYYGLRQLSDEKLVDRAGSSCDDSDGMDVFIAAINAIAMETIPYIEPPATTETATNPAGDTTDD